MRVAVDARLLDICKTGGTQYTRRLLESLAMAAPADEFVVVRRRSDDSFAPWPNLRQLAVAEAVLGDERWEQLRLPLLLRDLAPDVYFAPTSILPAVRVCPAVTVVYDLGFLRHPQFYSQGLRGYLRRWLPPSARRADAVVCLSAAVVAEVQQLVGVAAARLHVVAGAADESFALPAGSAATGRLCSELGLRRPFVLCVSSSERNKRLPDLVAAFASARAGAGADDWQLVLAGPEGAAEAELREAVQASPCASAVKRLGFVPDDLLPLLYQACEVFAFPSCYEGFGLPALEAMAAGRPVICADSGAVAEVAAGAARMVPAADAAALASALAGLMADAPLRQSLGARARMRAADYTWSRSAEALLEVFRALAP